MRRPIGKNLEKRVDMRKCSDDLFNEMPPILNPCPNSPNCVSSQSKTQKHFIQPICFSINPNQAWENWKTLIKEHQGLISIESTDSQLTAIFATRFLKFKDRLDCILNRESCIIHVRSASSLGYWDLGVNRRRIERLRSSFNDLIQTQNASK